MTSLPGAGAAGLLPGRRAALVVATGIYADRALTRLGATARDAEQMTAVLGDPGIGAFDVTRVIDRGDREIKMRVEDFLAGCIPDDMIVVYLSCHGLLDRWGRLYFAAADTRKDKLASTAVEATWLMDRLEHCRARGQVVILDCCFSGAFAVGAKGEEDGLRLEQRFTTHGRGRVVLTASSETEQSWEGDPVDGVAGPSVFTRALAKGLQTWAADTDDDGRISADEAYFYASREVLDSGASQTPQIYIYGGVGKLWLALRPATPTSAPALAPGHFRAAQAAPEPALRAGTVNPLEKEPAIQDLARDLAAGQARGGIAGTAALAPAPQRLAPGDRAPGGGPPGSTAILEADRTPTSALRHGRKKLTRVRVLGACGTVAVALAAALISQNAENGTAHTPGTNAAHTNAVHVYSGSRYGFNGPDAIAVDGPDLWVANAVGNSVTELNASDGSWVRTLTATWGFEQPDGIAVSGTDLWVANGTGNSVTEVDSDGNPIQTVPTAGPEEPTTDPEGVVVKGPGLWVANAAGNSVTELNTSDGSLLATLTAGRYYFRYPDAIATDGTDLWVANAAGNSVTELNSDGGAVRTLIAASYKFDFPDAIATDGTHLWVANRDGNSVTELNTSDGSLVRTLIAASYKFDFPDAIATDGTHLWVANRDGNSVTELNTSDGSLVRTLIAASYKFDFPDAIATDGTHLWVANRDGNSVTELPS